jgi:hypothetical protein
MNSLDTFIDQAWSDHAEEPAAVATRLPEGLLLVESDDQVSRLAMLAHHVMGEHLRQWGEAIEFLTALASRGAHGEGGAGTLARCQASLSLCTDVDYDFTTMGESDQCRAMVMAASNLAAIHPARATRLLEDAVMRASTLPDGDPGVRSLAAFSNNIAGTLRELNPLSTEQRNVMIRSAQVARTQWERAGTWLEVERAEYRLAVCWLAAGDAKLAMQHAKNCNSIVQHNGSEPLELFFAAEALAHPAQMLGDELSHSKAIATAQAAFATLRPEDQAWCRVTLEKLTSS